MRVLRGDRQVRGRVPAVTEAAGVEAREAPAPGGACVRVSGTGWLVQRTLGPRALLGKGQAVAEAERVEMGMACTHHSLNAWSQRSRR